MLWAGKDAKGKKKPKPKPLSATVCYYFQSFVTDFKPLGMVSTHVLHRTLPSIPGGAVPKDAQ